jgi:dGTPase
MAEPRDFMNAESVPLAPYAMHAANSAGRMHSEPPHPYRNPYQRDRDRIIHSSAFRRLAHKTQVFTGTMGDYHRSRLTHTLEMASIARTVGRTLGLNEDLIEALALAHDIGHPPFGHAGESVLDECLAREGGFNHNQQALRIVERLETRYPEFPGLNLSREILDGQRSRTVRRLEQEAGGRLLEVQGVDAADSIAYNAHDADDAVELGMIDLPELDAAALWRTAGERARRRYAALDATEFRRATVHQVIDLLANDLIEGSFERLREVRPASAAEARRLPNALVRQSADLAEQKAQLQRFLFERVYRHPIVLEQRARAGAALVEMFDRLVAHPEQLPAKFAAVADEDGLPRAVADYLAGMTDRYALEEHDRMKQRTTPSA